MGDQAALQEAIQRARQLAARISQNPPVKRPASELDDHSIGTVKVTLAYEKPANPPEQTNKSSEHQHRSSSNINNNNSNNNNNSSSNRGARDDNSLLGGHNNYSNNPPDSNYKSDIQQQQQHRSTSNYNSRDNSNMLGGGTHHNNYSSLADEKIEIIIPHAVIGLVIGKGGENIKRIQNETGATVRVDPNTVDEKGNKVCTITGTKQAVDEAHNQVANVIENAATNKRPRTQVEGSDQYRMKIPASRTGAIIGKGGDTIKSIKQQSGCDIELDKNAKDCSPDDSVFVIRGTQDKIQKARAMIEARLASRGRDDMRDNRSHTGPKGVATGANAAPVAQFTDLPNNYPAAGQQSAEMAAAWQAYYQQYSTLFSQAGTQPGAAGITYPGQNLLGSTVAQPVAQPDQSLQQQQQQQSAQQQQQSTQHQSQPLQQPLQSGAQPGTDSQSQQDYTEQWIEFYIMNGRPDYAEQIIEMKRQQQAQQKQQQQPQTPQ